MTGRAEETYRPQFRQPVDPARDETPYSWLPGIGLNLIPRSATPSGFGLAASMAIAVQMMLMEVAAMAVVPWPTEPVAISTSTALAAAGCVEYVSVARWAISEVTFLTSVLEAPRVTNRTVCVSPLKFVQ